jgi:hypothetical protein
MEAQQLMGIYFKEQVNWIRSRDVAERDNHPMQILEEDPAFAVEALPVVNFAKLDHPKWDLTSVLRVKRDKNIHTLPEVPGFYSRADDQVYATHITVFAFTPREEERECTWASCKMCRLTHRCGCEEKKQPVTGKPIRSVASTTVYVNKGDVVHVHRTGGAITSITVQRGTNEVEP